jgi:hypothetical protein
VSSPVAPLSDSVDIVVVADNAAAVSEPTYEVIDVTSQSIAVKVFNMREQWLVLYDVNSVSNADINGNLRNNSNAIRLAESHVFATNGEGGYRFNNLLPNRRYCFTVASRATSRRQRNSTIERMYQNEVIVTEAVTPSPGDLFVNGHHIRDTANVNGVMRGRVQDFEVAVDGLYSLSEATGNLQILLDNAGNKVQSLAYYLGDVGGTYNYHAPWFANFASVKIVIVPLALVEAGYEHTALTSQSGNFQSPIDLIAAMLADFVQNRINRNRLDDLIAQGRVKFVKFDYQSDISGVWAHDSDFLDVGQRVGVFEAGVYRH